MPCPYTQQETAFLLFYLIQVYTHEDIADILVEKILHTHTPTRGLYSVGDKARSLRSLNNLNGRDGKINVIKAGAFLNTFLQQHNLPHPGSETNSG